MSLLTLDEIRTAVTPTTNEPMSTWRADQWTAQNSHTREAFQQLVEHHPSSCFDEFSKHSFWKGWASKGSGMSNNILCFALGRSVDATWVDKLSAHGVDFKPHFLKQIRCLPFDRIAAALQACQRNHLWEPSHSDENESFFKMYLNRGFFDFAQLMWSNNIFCHRFNGVEAEVALFATKNLHETTHTQALLALWSQWGEPDASQWRELFSRVQRFMLSGGGGSRNMGFALILEKWNPGHSQWSEQDGKNIVEFLLKHSGSSIAQTVLLKSLDEGWFSHTVLSDCMSEIRPRMLDDRFVFLSKKILNHQLSQVTPTSSAKRRM